MPAALLRVLLLLLPLILLIIPPERSARADDVLLTLGDMLRLRELPLEADGRDVSAEEVARYQGYELYTYTAFEVLQVANSAAELITQEPLFCAPEGTFHFDRDGDVMRLGDHVTDELFSEETGGPLDRYQDQPASLALLLGLRAAFPCDRSAARVAQR